MSLSQSWRMWCSTCPSLLVNFPHKISMVFWSIFPCSPVCVWICSGALLLGQLGGSAACVPHPPDAVGQCGMFSSWRRQGCKKECPTQAGTYPTPTCVMLLISHRQNKSQGRTQSQGPRIYYPPSSPNNEAMTKQLDAERVEELWRIHLIYHM